MTVRERALSQLRALIPPIPLHCSWPIFFSLPSHPFLPAKQKERILRPMCETRGFSRSYCQRGPGPHQRVRYGLLRDE
jgi:hypothetical protein